MSSSPAPSTSTESTSSARHPPLSGTRALVLGGSLPGTFCAHQLRGFGMQTTVAAVREPWLGALTSDEAALYLDGARTLSVDHRRPDTVTDVVSELIGEVDVVIDETSPGWLEDHAIDIGALRERRPELVVCSITPYGRSGPRAGWRTTPAVAFAAGGLMSLTGELHRPPLVTGGSQAYLLAGLHAFAAVAAGMFGRWRTGRGDWIDLSMQEVAASMPELYGAMSEYELGEAVPRSGNSVRSVWGVYRCADGFAGVCCLERQVPAFFEILGPVVSEDERFTDLATRKDHDDELLAHVMGFMLEHTKDELLRLGAAHRVPFGAVRTPAELLDDEAYAMRGFFDRRVRDGGTIRVPGRPFPGIAWQNPADAEAGAGRAWADAGLIDEPTEPRAPLEGVRVLDLSMMWAGPYATKLLAELGAEVIKIESPRAWDNIRTLVPQDPSVADPWNSAYYFNEYNHSKRSLTLDLAQDSGRELFLRLASTADVVIENYRADVMDKLGLTTDALLGANSRLVVVSMAGFGKTGPLRDNVGFGPIIEMMSGLMSLTGYGDDGVPYKTGVSYGDPVGGLNAVAAVMLGLLQRDQRGEAVVIDLAQRETASIMAGPAFVAAARGEEPHHWGNRHPDFVPQGCYPSAATGSVPVPGGEWLVLSCPTDRDWAEVADVIGRTDLAELDAEAWAARHDELDEAITAWSASRGADASAAELQQRGVPAAAVADTFGIHDDVQLTARGFYVEVPNPKMRPYRQTGPTWRRMHTPAHRMRRSPWFGEDNDRYLDELGVTAEQRRLLADRHVISDAPLDPKVG